MPEDAVGDPLVPLRCPASGLCRVLRNPSPSAAAVPRPDWMRHSPFPTGLLVAPRHGKERLLLTLLFLTVLSSALVVIDIVYSTLMVTVTFLSLLLGVRMDRANMPFILLLIIYNLGVLISLQWHLDYDESRAFAIGTAFVGVTGIFFAISLNENTLQRFEAIRWGAITGAVIASTYGLLGYFGLIAGGTLYGTRLSGTFNDPNVFGSFAAAASVLLASDILNGGRHRLIKLGALLVILGGLFMSFSRGSWFNVTAGLMILFAVTLVTTRDAVTRARIIIAAFVGLIILGLALAAILSNDELSAIFADRFVLQKDYDSGPSGRFGSQLRSIPDLMGRPFGHGPNRFWFHYPENPHNTYIMGFSSYGWLGGIAFLCFAISTFWVTLRAAFTRSPFQIYAVAAFAMLVPHLIQNFQIDTDRWRHLFMIYGLCWGIAAVSARYQREYLAYAHAAYRAAANR